SNLLKKIDIFDLFYKDNSINRYYEKSNNNFKKLELNSSYDSINITKNNLIITNNLGGNSIENYKSFDLKVSSNVENSLYKCYLMFNNEIIDVKYGYNFKENDQIKKNDIKFDTQLTFFAGKFVESKVYCNFLNSNLNYKMFEKNYTITSNPQDFGNTEFKNQEVLLNKKGFPQNFEQDGIIKSANSDFEINSGYNKFNLNYLNQSYTNQEVIYTDLNEIKIFTNQNKGVLIYNPYQVSNITYKINGVIKSSINKYSSILLSDSITNTNNNIEIKYIINGQEKIITKTFDKTNDKIISESENIIYYDSNLKTYFMKYNSNQEQFKFNFGQGNNDVNFYSNCNISKSPSEYIVNLDQETCYLYSETTKIILINESQIYNKVNLLITKDSKILDVLDFEQRIRFDKGNVFSQTKNADNKYFIDLLNLDEKLFLSNIYLNENDLTCNLESYDFIKNNDFFRSVENLNPYGTFNLTNLKYTNLCIKTNDNYVLNLTELSKNNFEIIDGKNNLLISSSNNIQVGKQFYNESGFNQINYLNDFIKDYISPQIIEIGNYSNKLEINFSEDPILEKDKLYFTKNKLDELKIDSSSLFNKKIINLSFIIDGRSFEIVVDYDEENIKIINYLNNEYIIQEDSNYDLGEEFNLSYENNFFVLKYKSNEQFRFKSSFEDSIITFKNLSTTFDLNINLETINSEIFTRELKLRKMVYGKVVEFFSDTYNEQQIIGIFNEYESKDNIKLKDRNFSFYTDYELKCNYTLKYAQNAYNEYEDEFLNYHVYNINYTTFTDSTIGDVEIKCSNQEGKLMLERNFQINGSLKNNELILQKFSLFGSEDEIKELINNEISKGEVLIYYDSSNKCGLNFGMEWLAKKQVKLIKDNINLINCNGENLNIYLKNIESNDIIKFDFFVLNENENNKFRIFGENQSIPKTGKNYIYTFSNYICKVNEIECAGFLKLHECQIDNEIFNLSCQRTDGTNDPINERDYNLTANNQIILTDNSNIDKNIFEVNVSCKYNEYDLENYVIYDGNKYKNQEVLILENNTLMQYYCEYNNEHILLDNKTITIESEYNLKEIKNKILENSYYSNEINYIYGKKVNIKSDIEYLSGYDNKDYYNNKYNYYIDLENKKYSILTINVTDKIIISNPSYYYNIANDKFYSQVFDEND
ncbi:MAG: hypothetical protein PHT94_02635, partial [Candidatus Nanoarchaeia archaeon]|nr:hypothetical protein [Candidatus Nanoarchaeia archaeon]